MTDAERAILWIRGGPDDGGTINLREGTMLMGRALDNDIVVEEPNVSRQHAGIRSYANGYWIQDMGSRNGTFVNGDALEGEGRKLRDMDRIELGGASSVHWVFREMGATVEFTLPSRT